MNKNVSKYMALIGGKGGAKRATHPLRIEMARKAAAARWLKAKRLSIERATHLASNPNESPSIKQTENT